MKLSGLKASDYEVREWIEETFKLTAEQKRLFDGGDAIRFSKFYFYVRRARNKHSILWRLTVLVWPVYWIVAFLFACMKWLITGNYGLPVSFIEKFHAPWANKIKL